MRQGPEVCRGLEILRLQTGGRTNTGGICRQLCEAGRGGGRVVVEEEEEGQGQGREGAVLGGGEGREEGRGRGFGGGGGGVDLQSEHNQPSVFIRLVVCESRNKCV